MAAVEQANTQVEPVVSTNAFYQKYYFYILIFLFLLILFLITAVFVVYYQMQHRPKPVFNAVLADGTRKELIAYETPNLLPGTIIRWAAKGATLAYNFDFYNYRSQLALARPYFTEAGWQDYLGSVDSLINSIVERQLFVNGVVSGTPVISNQGPLAGKDYVWRVQVPFLVTYQAANVPSQRNFIVVLTITRVPTQVNPQGIGVDQFVMVGTL